MSRYIVEASDRAGTFARAEAATFAGMVHQWRTMRSRYGTETAVYTFGNVEHADVDTNGLTDEERERLEEIGAI